MQIAILDPKTPKSQHCHYDRKYLDLNVYIGAGPIEVCPVLYRAVLSSVGVIARQSHHQPHRNHREHGGQLNIDIHNVRRRHPNLYVKTTSN